MSTFDSQSPTDAAVPPTPPPRRASASWRALSLLTYVILPPSFWPGLDQDGKWNNSESSGSSSTTTPGRSKTLDVVTEERVAHRRALSDSEIVTRSAHILSESSLVAEPEEEDTIGSIGVSTPPASPLEATNFVPFPTTREDDQATSVKQQKTVSFDLPASDNTPAPPPPTPSNTVLVRTRPPLSSGGRPRPTSLPSFPTSASLLIKISYLFSSPFRRKVTLSPTPPASTAAISSRFEAVGSPRRIVPEEESATAEAITVPPESIGDDSCTSPSSFRPPSISQSDKESDQGPPSPSLKSIEVPTTPVSQAEELPAVLSTSSTAEAPETPELEPAIPEVPANDTPSPINDSLPTSDPSPPNDSVPTSDPPPTSDTQVLPTTSEVEIVSEEPKLVLLNKGPLAAVKMMEVDSRTPTPHLPGWYPPTPDTFTTAQEGEEERGRTSFDSELVLDDLDGYRRRSDYFASVPKEAEAVLEDNKENVPIAVEEESTPKMEKREMPDLTKEEELVLPAPVLVDAPVVNEKTSEDPAKDAEEEEDEENVIAGEVGKVVEEEEEKDAIPPATIEEPSAQTTETPSIIPVPIIPVEREDSLEVETIGVPLSSSDQEHPYLQSASSTTAAVEDLSSSTTPVVTSPTELQAESEMKDQGDNHVIPVVAGAGTAAAAGGTFYLASKGPGDSSPTHSRSGSKVLKSILRPSTPNGSRVSLEKTTPSKVKRDTVPDEDGHGSRASTPVKERERKISLLGRKLSKRNPKQAQEEMAAKRQTWIANYVGVQDPSKEVFPASEQHPDVDAPQRRRTLSKRRRPLSMSVVSSSDHEHTSIGTTAGSTISRGIYFPSGSLTHEPLLADEGQQSEGRVRKDSISGKRKLHKPSPAEKEWKRTISISNGLPHNDEGYQKVPNNRRSILGRSLSMSLPSKDAPTSPLPPIPSTKPKTPSPVLPVETNLAELNSSQSPQSQPNGAPEATTPSDSMKKRPRFKSFRRSLSSFGGRRPSTSPEDTPVTPYVPANHESPASSRPGTGIGVSNVERATGSTASASGSEHETRAQYEEPATIEGGEKPKRRLSRLLGSLRKGGDGADGVKRERSKLKKQTTSKLSTEVEVPVGAAA